MHSLAANNCENVHYGEFKTRIKYPFGNKKVGAVELAVQDNTMMTLSLRPGIFCEFTKAQQL